MGVCVGVCAYCVGVYIRMISVMKQPFPMDDCILNSDEKTINNLIMFIRDSTREINMVIGVSLSKPHTSVTALRKLCVCLRPYTVNFK